MKQKLAEPKGEIGKSTIILEVLICYSVIIGKANKKISKDINNWTIAT